ncbi:MAG: hypothetical protein KGZ58_03810 [Ignavibacteriales bacterium]|nr:hypothetical protein [Ignavibacteriales bacterium]
MKQFNLLSNINAETFKAAKFIATIFANASLWDKSWMMKLKTLFDFSQLSSRAKSRDNVVEAKRIVVVSFSRTWQAIPSGEVRGYYNSPLVKSLSRIHFGRVWGILFFSFLILNSTLLIAQKYTTNANTVLLSK